MLKSFTAEEMYGKNTPAEQSGAFFIFWAGSLTRLGQIAYLLRGDVKTFRSDLRQAAEIGGLIIPELLNEGKPISPDALGTIQSQYVQTALTAGDLDLARSVSLSIGAHPAAEKRSHPWDIAFAHTLRAVVLSEDTFGVAAELLRERVKVGQGKKLRALSNALMTIGERDVDAVQSALLAVVTESKALSKGRGLYAGSLESLLSTKGVALANLAISMGMRVHGMELIPQDLLIAGSDDV